MLRALFCYGTLLDQDVRACVLGKSHERLTITNAWLPDFRRVGVRQKSYPALVVDHGDRVDGIVIGGINTAMFDALVRYEGTEYRPVSVTVQYANTFGKALTFMPRRGVPLDQRPWNFSDWQKKEKAAFLKQF